MYLLLRLIEWDACNDEPFRLVSVVVVKAVAAEAWVGTEGQCPQRLL